MTKQNSTLQSALLEAQMNMPGVGKEGVNPHFRSKYATLEDSYGVIIPVLNAAGLTYTERFDHADGTTFLMATITHVESGQSSTSMFPLLLEKQTAQGMGSAITYARRYVLLAMGMSCPVDDDGETAESVHRKAQAQTSSGTGEQTQAKTQAPAPDGTQADERILGYMTTLSLESAPMSQFLENCAGYHNNSPRPATEKQHGLICGLIDTAMGEKDLHGQVLAILTGQVINKDNRIGNLLFESMLSALYRKSDTFSAEKNQFVVEMLGMIKRQIANV